jgi:hypothetical protein
MVANDQSSETQRRAGKLRADLQYGDIEEILATGLHAFLTQFLDRVNDLGARISRDFLIPPDRRPRRHQPGARSHASAAASSANTRMLVPLRRAAFSATRVMRSGAPPRPLCAGAPGSGRPPGRCRTAFGVNRRLHSRAGPTAHLVLPAAAVHAQQVEHGQHLVEGGCPPP